MVSTSPPILAAIRAFLNAQGIVYRILHHEPTRTSAESAAVRGEDLRIGAKAILMKVDADFHLFVLSAELRIDSRAVKQHLKAKSIRFATHEELAELTGLEPGAVPPFGRPILPFELYIDPSVFDNEKVAFNAGSITDSIIMRSDDYRREAKGVEFRFAT